MIDKERVIQILEKQKAEFLEEWVDYGNVAEAYDMAIESLKSSDMPEKQPIGVVKEYDNGMVSMRKETYKEYEDIAVLHAIRNLGV